MRRIASVLITIILLVSAHAQTTNQDQINLLLSSLPAGKDPQRYKGYVEPQFKEFVQRSFYLTMRDGVKIAVSLMLPKDLPADQKLPAIMTMTRYWRGREGGQPNTFIASHGYATVFVDARGTGASFGVWKAPFSQDEVKDYNEVVNWIVAQPWSNGKVGAIGSSYTGNTALWLATTLNPAVKAVLPRHYEFDLYVESPYPGGLLTDWVIRTWNEGNRQLDTNPGVKLVDEDVDKKLYEEAMKRRGENINVYEAALHTTFRDDRSFGYTLDELSLHSYTAQIEKSKVAINNWGGWFDASTADAILKTFLTLNNHQRAVIGPWNHGATQNASVSNARFATRDAVVRMAALLRLPSKRNRHRTRCRKASLLFHERRRALEGDKRVASRGHADGALVFRREEFVEHKSPGRRLDRRSLHDQLRHDYRREESLAHASRGRGDLSGSG